MPGIKIDSAEMRRAKGRYAVRKRDHGSDSPLTQAAHDEFYVERYLAAVQAAVTDAPDLGPTQKERLRSILAPVVATVLEHQEPDVAAEQIRTGDALADIAEQAAAQHPAGGAA